MKDFEKLIREMIDTLYQNIQFRGEQDNRGYDYHMFYASLFETKAQQLSKKAKEIGR